MLTDKVWQRSCCSHDQLHCHRCSARTSVVERRSSCIAMPGLLGTPRCAWACPKSWPVCLAAARCGESSRARDRAWVGHAQKHSKHCAPCLSGKCSPSRNQISQIRKILKGNKKEQAKRDDRAKFAVFSQIFADFCCSGVFCSLGSKGRAYVTLSWRALVAPSTG